MSYELVIWLNHNLENSYTHLKKVFGDRAFIIGDGKRTLNIDEFTIPANIRSNIDPNTQFLIHSHGVSLTINGEEKVCYYFMKTPKKSFFSCQTPAPKEVGYTNYLHRELVKRIIDDYKAITKTSLGPVVHVQSCYAALARNEAAQLLSAQKDGTTIFLHSADDYTQQGRCDATVEFLAGKSVATLQSRIDFLHQHMQEVPNSLTMIQAPFKEAPSKAVTVQISLEERLGHPDSDEAVLKAAWEDAKSTLHEFAHANGIRLPGEIAIQNPVQYICDYFILMQDRVALFKCMEFLAKNTLTTLQIEDFKQGLIRLDDPEKIFKILSIIFTQENNNFTENDLNVFLFTGYQDRVAFTNFAKFILSNTNLSLKYKKLFLEESFLANITLDEELCKRMIGFPEDEFAQKIISFMYRSGKQECNYYKLIEDILAKTTNKKLFDFAVSELILSQEDLSDNVWISALPNPLLKENESSEVLYYKLSSKPKALAVIMATNSSIPKQHMLDLTKMALTNPNANLPTELLEASIEYQISHANNGAELTEIVQNLNIFYFSHKYKITAQSHVFSTLHQKMDEFTPLGSDSIAAINQYLDVNGVAHFIEADH